MSSKMKRVGSAAAMTNDKAKLSIHGLLCALPGFAEQSCLIARGKRVGFRDINLRRVQPERHRHHAIKDVLCRHDQQSNRPGVAFREGDDLREEITFCLLYTSPS